MKTLTVTLAQTESSADLADNLQRAEHGFAAATAAGSRLLVLPENILCRGSYDEMRHAAKALPELSELLGARSAAHRLAAVWGGVAVTADGGCFNTALVFDADGSLLASYRKIHLFQFAHSDAKRLDETSLFTPGAAPTAFELDGWRIGLSICYDLRFPELYRHYAGVDLLLCTAEFTHQTGRAHWQTLLRARAIENQCYVAAVNQCGMNRTMNFAAYGHSLIADPWGELLALADETEICLHQALQRDRLTDIRARLPALAGVTHPNAW